MAYILLFPLNPAITGLLLQLPSLYQSNGISFCKHLCYLLRCPNLHKSEPLLLFPPAPSLPSKASKETLPSTSSSASAFNTSLEHLHFSQPCSLFQVAPLKYCWRQKHWCSIPATSSLLLKNTKQWFAQQVLWAFSFSKFSAIYTCSLHPLCSEGLWSPPFNCISETSWKAMNYITLLLKTLSSVPTPTCFMCGVPRSICWGVRLKLRPSLKQRSFSLTQICFTLTPI